MPQYNLPGEDTKTLAIVGGGYAGTVAALHLILKAIDDPAVTTEHPLRLTMIERHPQQLRGGVAYGKVPNFEHKLNLSSKRITPFWRGQPPEGFPTFDEYLEQRSAEDPGMVENFANPKRPVFGDYMAHLYDLALEKAGGKVKVDTRFGEVVDFEDSEPGNVVLKFKDGSRMDAMHAIMAVGNKDAAKPKFVFNIVANTHYLDSAYSPRGNRYFERAANESEKNPDAAALVFGTGLSAMDNAMRLIASGYKGKIVMMSRHGEMHPVYQSEGVPLKGLLKGEPRPESELPFMQEEPRFVSYIGRAPNFDSLIRRMQAEFRQLNEDGGYTAEEIVNHWERYNHKVFDRFPDETIKYLTANKTMLNIMRVGTVPEVFGKLQEAVRSGQLSIQAGDVENITAKGAVFTAKITPNNDDGEHVGPTQELHFTHVMNGIGFDNRYDLKKGTVQDLLWRNLQSRNGFQPHVTHAGVSVTEDFTLVKADGTPYNNVTLIGVPVAGHMQVTPYPYPEKEGEGTRVAAFSLNIQGILGGTLAMIERKFGRFRDQQQENEHETAGLRRTVARQPSAVRA